MKTTSTAFAVVTTLPQTKMSLLSAILVGQIPGQKSPQAGILGSPFFLLIVILGITLAFYYFRSKRRSKPIESGFISFDGYVDGEHSASAASEKEKKYYKRNGWLCLALWLASNILFAGFKISGVFSVFIDSFINSLINIATAGLLVAAIVCFVTAKQIGKEDRMRWHHWIVTWLFPYVALPWGIVNMYKDKNSSGITMVIISSIILLFFIVPMLMSISET